MPIDLKQKMRAKIAATKIARSGDDAAYAKLREIEKELKITAGKRRDFLEVMYDTLSETLDLKASSFANSTMGGAIGYDY
jgi:hypothetical protein